MPPATAIEQVYADAIDSYSRAIGYEAALGILVQAFLDLKDATLRQAFHIDGGLMKEFAEIVDRYPRWRIWFFPDRNEVEITRPAGAPGGEEERDEIARELSAAFDRWNKLPGIPGIRDAFKITFEER